MKKPRVWSAAVALLAMVAGSNVRGQESLDPQGNYPDLGKGNVTAAGPGTGRLEIYYERYDLRGGSRAVQDSRRARCRIYDVKGQFITAVTDTELPNGVLGATLTRGAYLVEVILDHVRWTPFWVSVEHDGTTSVDLSRALEKAKPKQEAPKEPEQKPPQPKEPAPAPEPEPPVSR